MAGNSKTKILIVEDDEMVRSFVTIHLENHGFEIVGVATGKALFAALEKQSYELIILDLNLPDGDGLEFAAELRKTDNTPIIIASARKGMDDRLTALNLGSIDYVTKPFDPQELYLRIKNLLNLSENIEDQTADQSPKSSSPEPNKTIQLKTAILGGIATTILILAAAGIWYWGKPAPETALMQPPPIKPNVAPVSATKTTKPQPGPKSAPPQIARSMPEPNPELQPERKQIIEKPIKCAEIPDVNWWSNKSHEAIRLYVQRKYAGDWTPYKKSWDRRLEKLVDILGRNSSAVASSGIVLAGAELEDYITKVEKRISVIDCLSKSKAP